MTDISKTLKRKRESLNETETKPKKTKYDFHIIEEESEKKGSAPSLFSSICTLPGFIGNTFVSFLNNSYNHFFSEEDKIEDKNDTRDIPPLLKELLQRHRAELPQNVDTEQVLPLIKKLHTALIYSRRTLVIGSSNKKSDRKKMCMTNTKNVSIMRDNAIDLNYSSTHKNLLSSPHPLEYPIFKINPNNILGFSTFILKAEKFRIGNCVELSAVAASYLWRFPGKEIHRIELIKAKEFDHVWLILNRKKGSELLDPTQWGEDCWILDPWWGDEGAFYPAEKFHEKMIVVFSYLIDQYQWLKKNGHPDVPLETGLSILKHYEKDFQKKSLQVPIEIKDNISIDIDTMPYPLDRNARISDYYDFFTHQDKKKHQKGFSHCLEEIKTCNGTPKKFVKKCRNGSMT